jgi:hypothetical protein
MVKMTPPTSFRRSRYRDPYNYFRLQPFEGLDVEGSATEINDHESPDVLNMYADETGALTKRMGYQRSFATSLGSWSGEWSVYIRENGRYRVYPDGMGQSTI